MFPGSNSHLPHMALLLTLCDWLLLPVLPLADTPAPRGFVVKITDANGLEIVCSNCRTTVYEPK